VCLDVEGERIGEESAAPLAPVALWGERGVRDLHLGLGRAVTRVWWSSHGNVVRLLRTTEPSFGFAGEDVWTLVHSSAFDFSVWEVWGALQYGGRLVVVPYGVSRSPESFWDLVDREGATVVNQTPSACLRMVARRGRLRALDGGRATRTCARWRRSRRARHRGPRCRSPSSRSRRTGSARRRSSPTSSARALPPTAASGGTYAWSEVRAGSARYARRGRHRRGHAQHRRRARPRPPQGAGPQVTRSNSN